MGVENNDEFDTIEDFVKELTRVSQNKAIKIIAFGII